MADPKTGPLGELVVVTGMTGAGRSTAAKELEDLGYFVVDNLPPELVGDVVRLVDEKQGVATSRSRRWSTSAPGSFFDSLRAQLAAKFPTRRTTLLFLEASDDILVRRQEAARRPHPLQGSGRLLEGIDREREVMAAPARRRRPGHRHHRAQRPPAQGQGRAGLRHAGDRGAADHRGQLRVQVRRAGRRRPDGRHAVPAQPVLGARAARPHRTGRRRGGYVKDRADAPGVPRALRARDRDRGDGYLREGKRFMTVAIGCTGGKHRSVAMTEEIDPAR